jgi:hypothetical protein
LITERLRRRTGGKELNAIEVFLKDEPPASRRLRILLHLRLEIGAADAV